MIKARDRENVPSKGYELTALERDNDRRDASPLRKINTLLFAGGRKQKNNVVSPIPSNPSQSLGNQESVLDAARSAASHSCTRMRQSMIAA